MKDILKACDETALFLRDLIDACRTNRSLKLSICIAQHKRIISFSIHWSEMTRRRVCWKFVHRDLRFWSKKIWKFSRRYRFDMSKFDLILLIKTIDFSICVFVVQFSCFRMIASRMYEYNAKNKWLARWFSWNRSKSWFSKLFKCAHSCDTNCLKRCLNSLNFCSLFIKRKRCDAKCFCNVFLNNFQKRSSFIDSYLQYHTLKMSFANHICTYYTRSRFMQ